MPKFETPKMLARTLLILRKRRAHMSLIAFGEEIDLSKSQLGRIETRKASVDCELLEKYQLFLGIPNGILLVISHVAAMSRDVSRFSGRPRQREQDKLSLMATYLRNLADRIEQPGHQRDLRQPHSKISDDEKSWDATLLDIILATQKGLDTEAPTVFRDLARLKTLIRQSREAKNADRGAARPNGRMPA